MAITPLKFILILFAFIIALIVLYIVFRVVTKAIAMSWYEVKFKLLKEAYYGEEEKEENQFIEKSGEKISS